ncbi:hypothetical protein KUV59_11950 [Marinobacter daepoensis]|uniref:hypothetical protein n=1 Tax=Marinobacter daepoensis TaxID=262077 RepID=UPI001C957A4B|nr:hypothetical protein [Marinobacter daepoensis]MBY6033888.1 hypothetical protein [Marinobacter daepoensis]
MVKRYAFLITLSLLAGPVHAELRLPVTSLADAELDQLRGGFVMNNLEISIGLEQVLAVNGQTLVVNRLTIPNLNDPMAANRLSTQLASIQGAWESGAGQLALDTAVAGSGGWMTVIQNSLNGTTIQNIRQLNIELNNLGGAYQLPRDFSLPMLP